MRTNRILWITTVLTLSAGTFLYAKSAPDPTVSADTQEVPAPLRNPPGSEPRILSPMHKEIQAAVETEGARIEELNQRFMRAGLATERLSIQKEIETVKKGGQVTVLEIQLRYARVEGRSDVAGQLESALAAIRNPKPPQASGPTMLERAGHPGGK